MIEISRINAEQFKEYIEDYSTYRKESTFSNLDWVGVRNYFHTCDSDNFLMIKYVGEYDSLKKELDYITLPGKSFGKLFILNGKDLTVNNINEVQNIMESKIDDQEWEPLTTWSIDEDMTDVEFIFVTKIFSEKDLLQKETFDSLWDAIISDLNAMSNKGFYDCLRKVNWNISGNTLEICIQGMVRRSFILSLKKQEIEKSIQDYTGRKLFIKIE